MGEVRYVLVAEGGSAAFYGMRATENIIDGFLGIVAFFELQQAAFDNIEPVGAFSDEDLPDVIKAAVQSNSCHNFTFALLPSADSYLSMRLVISISLSGSNGFTIHPVAPASFPFIFISWENSVVR